MQLHVQLQKVFRQLKYFAITPFLHMLLNICSLITMEPHAQLHLNNYGYLIYDTANAV